MFVAAIIEYALIIGFLELNPGGLLQKAIPTTVLITIIGDDNGKQASSIIKSMLPNCKLFFKYLNREYTAFSNLVQDAIPNSTVIFQLNKYNAPYFN